MSTEKWDHRFMDLAELIAGWSKDPSTKCGAVIVDRNKRVMSVGFNGFPPGVEDHPNRLEDRQAKYRFTQHAEQNALNFAERDLEGCTIYVTLPPCASCAGMMASRGISRVVTKAALSGAAGRWGDDWIVSEQIFREAGINFLVLNRAA